MKKHIILAAMAATALFAACTNSDEEALTQGIPVNFTISSNGIVTRAATTASNSNYTTEFEENDKFGVYSDNLLANMNNTECTYTTSGVQTNQSFFFKDQSTNVNFVAYYPYSTMIGAGAGTIVPSASEISYTINNDQSGDRIKANDFMVATAQGTGANPTINLTFSHQLALIEVNLEDITASKVTINGVQPTVKWTATDTETSGEKVTVTMSDQTSGKKFWAMVPAQTIEANTTLFSIIESSTNKKFGYTTASQLSIQKNGVYQITLKKKETAESTNLTVTASNWAAPETIDGDGPKEAMEQYVEPVTTSTGMYMGTDMKFFVQGNEATIGYSWGRNMVCKDEEPIAIDGGWEIKLKNSTSDVRWSNNCMVYYGGDTQMPVGIYKLTFSLESTVASDIKVRLMLYDSGATNNNTYFGVADSPEASTWQAGKKITISEVNTPSNQTIYLNTKLKGTSANYINTVNTNNDAATQYYLYFEFPNPTGTQTITIKNIKIERI